jgi:hypothetical protein
MYKILKSNFFLIFFKKMTVEVSILKREKACNVLIFNNIFSYFKNKKDRK